MLTKAATGAVLAAVVLGVFAAGAPGVSSSRVHRCGSLSIRQEGAGTTRYSVKVTRGTLKCSHARRVMRRFLARAVITRGWACFRGHGGDPWAASCATTRRPTRVVRAYERD